jgi:hypothetical protein
MLPGRTTVLGPQLHSTVDEQCAMAAMRHGANIVPNPGPHCRSQDRAAEKHALSSILGAARAARSTIVVSHRLQTVLSCCLLVFAVVAVPACG